MATIRIEIETDNEAFTDDPRAELARILRGYAHRLDMGGTIDYRLHDSNGNTVGKVVVE